MNSEDIITFYIEKIESIHEDIRKLDEMNDEDIIDTYAEELISLITDYIYRGADENMLTQLLKSLHKIITTQNDNDAIKKSLNEFLSSLQESSTSPKHIKEEVQDDKDDKIQKLESKLASLLTRIPGQGQFPKRSRPSRRRVRGNRNPLPTVQKTELKSNSLLNKMEELIKTDPKLKEKLEKFISRYKTGNFYVSSLKRSIYISRANLDKLKKTMNEKEGGFLPLIPILAGIAAAGSVAGGAAGIASAVNKKNAEDAALAEQLRYNISLEDAARGKGLKDDVVKFVQDNDIDDDLKRMVKKTLKGFAAVIPMQKEGGSLILSPYRKDGRSLVLYWK